MIKSAITLVAAMAVTLAITSSASADANVSVSFGGHIRGLATFFSAGDEFRICDRRKDNLPVGLRYSYIRKNGKTQRGGVWHPWGVDGVGAPDSRGFGEKGCSYSDHNFGEGRKVWFQACVGQPEEEHFTCGPTQVTSTGPK